MIHPVDFANTRDVLNLLYLPFHIDDFKNHLNKIMIDSRYIRYHYIANWFYSHKVSRDHLEIIP